MEDSALYEKRPLLREDIQFDDFKPLKQKTGFSNRKVDNEAVGKAATVVANPREQK